MGNLLEISDGHLYSHNDMARLLCHDCEGCSDCCKDMDKSVVLDPYDIYMLSKALGLSFDQMYEKGIIELHVEDGLMLPNLKMVQKSANLAVKPECYFLDGDGRCSIHANRPGICRLYPLGRNYDDKGLSYFVLKDGCRVSSRQKVKIDKWLGIKEIKTYEAFLVEWHDLRSRLKGLLLESEDEAYVRAVTMGFIKLFYRTPYEKENFFTEVKERIDSL